MNTEDMRRSIASVLEIDRQIALETGLAPLRRIIRPGTAPVEPRLMNKDRMYEMLLSGELGNAVECWYSWQELIDSGYRGDVSLRAKAVADPVRRYHVPFEQLASLIAELKRDPQELVYCAAPPDWARTMQGELVEGPQGWMLYWTTVPLPMRLAFDVERRYASGLQAMAILRHHLDERDIEQLAELFERFPEHRVEFSAFSVRVGVQRRRLIIWEVRYY